MSGKYDEGREAFGTGELSWTRDKIVAQLVSSAYAFDPTHRGLGALKGLVGDQLELTDKSIELGWAKSRKLVFPQVKGDAPAAIVFHRDGGPLIFFHSNVVNLPMATNGGDIEVEIPERGIFRV